MSEDKLSGIERELVLKYLIDGNAPVTLTPIDENSDDETIHSVTSQIFPIALKAEHIKVNEDGKILLENPPQSVIGFENRLVKVEFYFNRVGLFFISKVFSEKEGLALLIPEVINRIKDIEENLDYDFSAVIYFDVKNKKEINTICYPWKNSVLFTKPVWKSIPFENQKIAKEYLEEFVEIAKKEKNAGNGIQLIPICNYLTFNEARIESIQNRIKPPAILYVDHERIVLGIENEELAYLPGVEYGLKMSFSIKNSPIASRDVFVICVVNKIYERSSKKCVDLIYTNLQEEDLRYLYEKTTKVLYR
ncbi:MAG: hypothetical protein K5829_04495 [Treponema sp.]|nr:hypothetical protein [Treponema sp.]